LAGLSQKSKNALDETRMLTLGAQVLVGFDYQAVFQPAFERLEAEMQRAHVLALALMLLALCLFILPGAYHQITETGNDTPELMAFTGRVAALGLLPFALSIGIELYVVVQASLGAELALAVSVSAAVLALSCWYALGFIWRARDAMRGRAHREQNMAEPTPLENRIEQVLTEARVVLPGAQALLGFQFAAMLMDAFAKLPRSSQYIHIASLWLIAATVVLLMTPAAFHRIVERGEDSERLHRFSSRMMLAGMVLLAFGITGDFYVVVERVLGAVAPAVGIALTMLLVFLGLWFGLTVSIRARRSLACAGHR
jgi:hypothetical protein